MEHHGRGDHKKYLEAQAEVPLLMDGFGSSPKSPPAIEEQGFQDCPEKNIEEQGIRSLKGMFPKPRKEAFEWTRRPIVKKDNQL